MADIPSRGLLRVVTPDEVNEMERAQQNQALPEEGGEPDLTRLAGHIRGAFDAMQRHRSSASGWNERLLNAQRVFNGHYEPAKLAAIKQFGGSDIYARIVAVKCRGASSMLREVYLGPEKPWGLDPTPNPELPDEIAGTIQELVSTEAAQMQSEGQPLDPMAIRDRTRGLLDAAMRANKKRAREEADEASIKLDDFLVEGNFYRALTEFIQLLPLFPFACLKGPVVRMVPDVVWQKGKPVVETRAKMFWTCPSPFDIYFTPGVSAIEDADVIERLRFTRADINQLLGLPGYNDEALRKVLEEYGTGGLRDWLDPTDAERAVNENRENPHTNTSGVIDCLEYHGNVQGKALLDYGFTKEQVPDPIRDHFVQAWLIGRHVIKVQLSPSPRKRHPYYITSFEKVPGTPVGNALPDILADIQDAGNAVLRALVNNLSISSGPQVVINDDRLAVGMEGDELYPWKRWHVTSDPMQGGGSIQPVYFFQPNSNAQELLTVYEKMTQYADELSAIPRYITGSERLGGAGRTSSGLAMLMGNAAKILQTVAANVDRDVMEPLLQNLYDLVMLTDQSGTFRGDEAIRVRGVDVAVQRETDRQRQIEFLQATANPIDSQIMGPLGRAKVLRSIAGQIGLEGQDVIPPEDELKAQMQPPMQPGGMPLPPGAGPPGEPGMEEQGDQAKPANQDLGVPEAKSMRGMV